MRIVFIGPPGSGKGTQSVRLADRLAIVHLSTGDMLRQGAVEKTPVGLQAQQYMLAGKLVPDPVMLDLVHERLDRSDCMGGYLLDGFPRTLVQAQALDAMLAKRRAPLSLVLDLQVEVEEIVRRLMARGRADDQPTVIRERLEQYARQTAPVSAYYERQELLRRIDGVGPPEDVFQRILDVVAQFPPARPKLLQK